VTADLSDACAAVEQAIIALRRAKPIREADLALVLMWAYDLGYSDRSENAHERAPTSVPSLDELRENASNWRDGTWDAIAREALTIVRSAP